MALDVTAETRIARRTGEVRAYVVDPMNDTQWIGGISESRLLTTGTLGVGSRVARVASFMGKRIEYVNEVTSLTDEELAMRSVEGPFPMEITYRFAEDGDSTRVGVRVRGDAGGFYRVAEPLMARQVRRSIEGDVERLRTILESASVS